MDGKDKSPQVYRMLPLSTHNHLQQGSPCRFSSSRKKVIGYEVPKLVTARQQAEFSERKQTGSSRPLNMKRLICQDWTEAFGNLVRRSVERESGGKFEQRTVRFISFPAGSARATSRTSLRTPEDGLSPPSRSAIPPLTLAPFARARAVHGIRSPRARPILDRTISFTRYEWGIQHKATNEE